MVQLTRVRGESLTDFSAVMEGKLSELSDVECGIISLVWDSKEHFIRWPETALLLWPGCIRPKGNKKHIYPEPIKIKLKDAGIKIDWAATWVNGPAVMAFIYAGGERPPKRSKPSKGWNIHHIYDNKHPWPGASGTLHSVKDGEHFTQSAGLVAIHPIAEALAEEYFYFSWLLRYESYVRFSYDPDEVLSARGRSWPSRAPLPA